MARVTVEDCIDKVESPYELVLVAQVDEPKTLANPLDMPINPRKIKEVIGLSK